MKRDAASRSTLTGADIVLISALLLLLLAATILLTTGRKPGSRATIATPEGEETVDISGSGEKKVYSEGLSILIRWSGGYIWVEESDCPNGSCLSKGRVNAVGERIICLPARMVITVTEGGEDGVDVWT